MPVINGCGEVGALDVMQSEEMLPLEQMQRRIEVQDYHAVAEILLVFAVNITEVTAQVVIERVYEILLQLIPNVGKEDLDRLSEYCNGSVLQKLFLFPTLVNQQWECAIAFGDAYLKHNAFSTAVSFYSVAIDLAEQEMPLRLKESHRKASSGIFEALELRIVSLDAYKNFLSIARGRGGEELFLEALSKIEAMHQYACDSEHLAFIHKLYNQANQVLFETPTERRESYKESAKLIQGRIFSTELPQVLSLTETLRTALQAYRKDFRESFKEITPEPLQVRVFQRKMAAAFQALVSIHFIEPTQRILCTLPSAYNFLAMGSVAREEHCPYSDLEWMILIEDPEGREGFKTFIEVLDLLMRSLRESPSSPQFTALCSPEKSGLHLDPGSFDDELITTPLFPKPRGYEPDFDPHSVRHTNCRVTSLFYFGKDLLPEYMRSKRSVLDECELDRPIRVNRACELMNHRLKKYRKLGDPFAHDIVNIKEHFAEPLFHLLGDLALYHGLEKTNTLDVIDGLDGVFTDETKVLLKYCVAKIYYERVAIHLEKERQCEMASPMSFVDVKLLVLDPLYARLEAWEGREGQLPPFQKVDLPEEAFMRHMAEFAKSPDHPKAKRMIEALKLHLQRLPSKTQQRYYRLLSTDVKFEPMREMFVHNLPLNSPLWMIPNEDGYRQSYRRGYESLKRMLMRITTVHEPLGTHKIAVKGIGLKMPRFLIPGIAQRLVKAYPGRNSTGGVLRKVFNFGQDMGSSAHSAHDVVQIAGDGFDIHLKEMPFQPLMEYAIHNFTMRLIGRGTTPSLLLRFETIEEAENTSIPVLATITLHGTPISGSSNIRVNQRSLTWMLIRSVLIKPGDERASNFILDQNKEIYCHDNDVAFVVPLVRTGVIKRRPYLKTILPFLSDLPLDRTVIAEFLNISPDPLFHAWLCDVRRMEQRYQRLFPTGVWENPPLLGKQKIAFTPTILVKEGSFAACYTQMRVLQEFFSSSTGEIHPLEILKAVITLDKTLLKPVHIGTRLYRCYVKGKKQALPPEGQLLHALDEKRNESITNEDALLASFERIPTLVEVKQRKETSVEEGLVELSLCNFQAYGGTIEVSKRGEASHFTADFGDKLLSVQPDLEHHRHMLRALFCHHGNQFESIAFLNASILTEEGLRAFLHEGLISLTVTHCPEITTSLINDIAQICPNLQQLRLESCQKLRRVDDGGVVRREPLSFPNLELLHLSKCRELSDVKVLAPKLQKVELFNNERINLGELIDPNIEIDAVGNLTFELESYRRSYHLKHFYELTRGIYSQYVGRFFRHEIFCAIQEVVQEQDSACRVDMDFLHTQIEEKLSLPIGEVSEREFVEKVAEICILVLGFIPTIGGLGGSLGAFGEMGKKLYGSTIDVVHREIFHYGKLSLEEQEIYEDDLAKRALVEAKTVEEHSLTHFFKDEIITAIQRLIQKCFRSLECGDDVVGQLVEKHLGIPMGNISERTFITGLRAVCDGLIRDVFPEFDRTEFAREVEKTSTDLLRGTISKNICSPEGHEFRKECITRLALNRILRESAFNRYLLITRVLGIGNIDWERYCGSVEEIPPLPWDIYDNFATYCPFIEYENRVPALSGRLVQHTHLLVLIPKRVSGKPLSIQEFSSFIRASRIGHPLFLSKQRHYSWGSRRENQAFQNKTNRAWEETVDSSHWLLIRRDLVQFLWGLREDELQSRAADIERTKGWKYRIPKGVEHVVASAIYHARHMKRFFLGRYDWSQYEENFECFTMDYSVSGDSRRWTLREWRNGYYGHSKKAGLLHINVDQTRSAEDGPTHVSYVRSLEQ